MKLLFLLLIPNLALAFNPTDFYTKTFFNQKTQVCTRLCHLSSKLLIENLKQRSHICIFPSSENDDYLDMDGEVKNIIKFEYECYSNCSRETKK